LSWSRRFKGQSRDLIAALVFNQSLGHLPSLPITVQPDDFQAPAIVLAVGRQGQPEGRGGTSRLDLHARERNYNPLPPSDRVIVLGTLAGLLPAVLAYRTKVAENLAPLSSWPLPMADGSRTAARRALVIDPSYAPAAAAIGWFRALPRLQGWGGTVG